MEQINIYRSRKQARITVVGGIGFVGLGVFMLTRSDVTPLSHAIAIIATVFFGFCALAGGYFLLRKKEEPLLIMSRENLILGTTNGGCYQIPWTQITDFEIKEWRGEVFLLIRIGDPEAAIAAETNLLQRKLLEVNNKTLGTPYCITPSMLDFPKGALLPQLRRLLKKYGNA